MRVILSRGVLEVLVKLAAEGMSDALVDEKSRVVRIVAEGGAVRFETRSPELEVVAASRDVQIIEAGSVQVGFTKLEKLSAEVNVQAEIHSSESECRIASGSAVWRLKVFNFPFDNVASQTDTSPREIIRSETVKDVLLRTKNIIPSDADNGLDNVRMVHISGGKGYSTDRQRALAVDFTPPLSNSINLSRKLTDSLLRFISVTGEPTIVISDEGDYYVVKFLTSYIKAKKLVLNFPNHQVTPLFDIPTQPWFDVRREDLVDGLRKVMVTAEYGEPRIQLESAVGASLVLISEDIMGNKGSATITCQATSAHKAIIRAELIRALIESAKGERISVFICEGKLIKLCSEGVSGVLMLASAISKGKPSAAKCSKSTKSAPAEAVGVGAGQGSQEGDD